MNNCIICEKETNKKIIIKKKIIPLCIECKNELLFTIVIEGEKNNE